MLENGICAVSPDTSTSMREDESAPEGGHIRKLRSTFDRTWLALKEYD